LSRLKKKKKKKEEEEKEKKKEEKKKKKCAGTCLRVDCPNEFDPHEPALYLRHFSFLH
jgi:hypothetical protein